MAVLTLMRMAPLMLAPSLTQMRAPTLTLMAPMLTRASRRLLAPALRLPQC